MMSLSLHSPPSLPTLRQLTSDLTSNLQFQSRVHALRTDSVIEKIPVKNTFLVEIPNQDSNTSQHISRIRTFSDETQVTVGSVMNQLKDVMEQRRNGERGRENGGRTHSTSSSFPMGGREDGAETHASSGSSCEDRKDSIVGPMVANECANSKTRNFVRGEKLNLITSPLPLKGDLKSVVCKFFLFSDALIFTTKSGVLGQILTAHEIALAMHSICEIVSDWKELSGRPLLMIGNPFNRPYAIFGSLPVVVEFPTFAKLVSWKESIDEIINRHKRYISCPILSELPARHWMAGYLFKCRVKGWTSFKKRYCVVKNHSFRYYASADDFSNEKECLGEFSLRSCFIELAPIDEYKYPSIQINCAEKKCIYIFGTESKTSLMSWCQFFKVNSDRLLHNSVISELLFPNSPVITDTVLAIASSASEHQN